MANLDSTQSRRRNPRLNDDSFSAKSDDWDVNIPTFPYKSSSEYAAAVNQWLWQCYNWQCLTVSLPYLMSQTACRIQNSNSDGTTDFNRNFPNTFFPNQNFSVVQPNRPNVTFQNVSESESQQSPGATFLIPSLFKRLMAEAIDFCILLILKVMITYIAVDFFDLVNLDKYDFDLIKNDKLDYQTAMEVTSEILTLEVIHRFVVCIFEALFTQRGILGAGGATPGKTIMRLRVITCESIVQLDSNTVRVYPAGDLGFGCAANGAEVAPIKIANLRITSAALAIFIGATSAVLAIFIGAGGVNTALVRAFIKNFSYAFIFPICCTMYFFQHNRTAYDHICGSVVVEELPRTTFRH